MGKRNKNAQEDSESSGSDDDSGNESNDEVADSVAEAEAESPPAKKSKANRTPEVVKEEPIDWKPVVPSTLKVGDEVQLPIKAWREIDEKSAESNPNPSELTGGELCVDDCPFEEDELQNATVVFIHKEGEYKGDIELLPFYCAHPMPGLGIMPTIGRFCKLYDGETVGPEWTNVVDRLVMLNMDSKDDKKYFKQMSKCEPMAASKIDAKEEMWH